MAAYCVGAVLRNCDLHKSLNAWSKSSLTKFAFPAFGVGNSCSSLRVSPTQSNCTVSENEDFAGWQCS